VTASQKKVVQYLSEARASKLALRVERAVGRARAFGKAPFDLLHGRRRGREETVLRVLPDTHGDGLTVQEFAGKLAAIDFHERKREGRAAVPPAAERELASA
jgi:hypothetical protein